METCPKCSKRFPSPIEDSAIRKKREADPEEWEKMSKLIGRRVCICPPANGSSFTSSTPPPDLQWHDKFDR